MQKQVDFLDKAITQIISEHYAQAFECLNSIIMNTYNENLRSSVVASLQSQELAQKTVSAALNAAMFTLYYAEGATVTANEKFKLASEELIEKSLVKRQAVISSNISNNQLLSAIQANQYAKQSVTNNSVCAANVQVAANAIIKLASDLGSIYSIVNGADSDTDIFNQAQEARDLINKTAYEAEVASRIAMKASALMSEVSASTVMSTSAGTNSAMTNMLAIANSDYDTVSQAVAAANTTVAVVSTKEKIAAGNFENANADNDSTNKAYNLTNQELNLNLTAVPAANEGSSAITVNFNLVTNPFNPNPTFSPIEPISVPVPTPIKDYYVVFSKDSSKATFEIGNAENLLLDKESKITVEVPVTALGASSVTKIIYYGLMPDQQGGIYTLNDTDGDAIKPSVAYVAFVIGVYNDDYKKKLNNYDDFLSAPSSVFTLTNTLTAVDEPIVVDVITPEIQTTLEQTGLDIPANPPMANEIIKDDTYFVAFNVTEVTDYDVDYRCMFLPVGKDIPGHMLTDKEFAALEHEEKKIQAISDKYNPAIAAAQAKLITISAEIENTNTLITELSGVSNTTAATKPKKGTLTPLEAAQQKLNKTTIEYNKLTVSLHSLQNEKQQALDDLTTTVHDRLGFMFNLTLAEQVLAGNYISAKKFVIPPTSSNDQPANDSQANSTTEYFCFTSIGPDTTDNFGNSLVNGNSYYPMILSFSTAEEDNLSMFTNALTDISKVKSFTYNIANN